MKNYCCDKLQTIELILADTTLAPTVRLRLMTKKNILTHIINFNTYVHFANIDELNEYIEDRADIVCGFYED